MIDCEYLSEKKLLTIVGHEKLHRMISYVYIAEIENKKMNIG